MRTHAFTTALALAVAALSPSRTPAEELPVVVVEVGARKTLGSGAAPICDDPQVAWISADGQGVLHGEKVGSTTCSLMVGGAGRRVFRVEVVPVKQKGGEKGGEKGKAPAGGPASGGA